MLSFKSFLTENNIKETGWGLRVPGKPIGLQNLFGTRIETPLLVKFFNITTYTELVKNSVHMKRTKLNGKYTVLHYDTDNCDWTFNIVDPITLRNSHPSTVTVTIRDNARKILIWERSSREIL